MSILGFLFKRKRKVKKASSKIRKEKQPQQEKIGKVTHYFPHVRAAVVKITKGSLSLGDSIHIKGHTTDFSQKITSMQIENEPIKRATKGKLIGLLVKSRVRRKDQVFKLKQ